MRMSLQVPQEAKGRLEESTAAGLVEVSHRLAPALQQPGLGEAQSQASVGARMVGAVLQGPLREARDGPLELHRVLAKSQHLGIPRRF